MNASTNLSQDAKATTASELYGLSREARNLHWLLGNLIDEVPGVQSVAVVSSDGLLLLSSDADLVAMARQAAGAKAEEKAAEGAAAGERAEAEVRERAGATGGSDDGAEAEGPRGSSADLATIVSGLGALTLGAAKLMDGGNVKQTMVSMDGGSLFVMSISDGSLLGVLADPDCDMNVVAYHMALFVGRAGHVLTPELRSELRKSMERD